MATKELRPVLIEWYDAESDIGWLSEEETASYMDESEPCFSVGFLLREPSDKFDWYVIVGEIDNAGSTNRRQKIPAKWVSGVFDLCPKKAK